MEDAVMAPLELALSKLVVVLLYCLGDLVAPPSTHAPTSLSLALPHYSALKLPAVLVVLLLPLSASFSLNLLHLVPPPYCTQMLVSL